MLRETEQIRNGHVALFVLTIVCDRMHVCVKVWVSVCA